MNGLFGSSGRALLGKTEENHEQKSPQLVHAIAVLYPPSPRTHRFDEIRVVYVVLWKTVLDSPICRVLMELKIHRIV